MLYAVTEMCPEGHGSPEERIAAALKAGKVMGQRKLPRTGDISAGTYSLRRSRPEEWGPLGPCAKTWSCAGATVAVRQQRMPRVLEDVGRD